MAKQTKTLADVQTVTTVNYDQLIPITDASGNVVKVSMSNLRAAMIGNLQASSINIINGSESFSIVATSSTSAKEFAIGALKKGDRVAVSIGDITVEEGSVDTFSVHLRYDSFNTVSKIITRDGKPFVFEIAEDCTKAAILFYAGIRGQIVAGNIVKFDRVMVVKGDIPCPSWFPSYNDIKALVAAGSTTAQSE